MRKGQLNIAIAGAGMGGLAAAAALRKQGVAVTVYEQARQFTRLGAGIQIGCNAMHVLRGLGLEPLLRAETFYPRSWNNRHWKTGEVLFDMLFGPSAETKYGAPYLLAHRGDLHEALASIVPSGVPAARPSADRHRPGRRRRAARASPTGARQRPTC